MNPCIPYLTYLSGITPDIPIHRQQSRSAISTLPAGLAQPVAELSPPTIVPGPIAIPTSSECRLILGSILSMDCRGDVAAPQASHPIRGSSIASMKRDRTRRCVVIRGEGGDSGKGIWGVMKIPENMVMLVGKIKQAVWQPRNKPNAGTGNGSE
ncbi:hypothetical protein Tco_1385007 [Tanacetum coccineum]